MKHRNDDLLLFIAIGDAVAAATEYVKQHEHPKLIESALRLDGYYQHPTHLDLKPGMYTDDTQMSIAVAEVLLPETSKEIRIPGHLPTPLDFANAFTRAFHRDPRDGYARGFQAFLESHKTGIAFMHDIRPDSIKNGACMRAVPIGVISDIFNLQEVADVQAGTTHKTHLGIRSAQIVAIMSHFALYHDEPMNKLGDYLTHVFRGRLPELGFHFDPDQRWHGPVKNPAINTIHAVFDLLTHCSTLSEVLRGAIQFGGDTDSVAAIALGIASCRMLNDLPQVLFDKLENGPYGRNYLATLGKQLMDAHT